MNWMMSQTGGDKPYWMGWDLATGPDRTGSHLVEPTGSCWLGSQSISIKADDPLPENEYELFYRSYNPTGFITAHPRWLGACKEMRCKYWLWREHKRLTSIQCSIRGLRKEIDRCATN